MWKLISREPVLTGTLIQAIFVAGVALLPASVPVEAKAALLGLGAALSLWVRSAVTPNSKL